MFEDSQGKYIMPIYRKNEDLNYSIIYLLKTILPLYILNCICDSMMLTTWYICYIYLSLPKNDSYLLTLNLIRYNDPRTPNINHQMVSSHCDDIPSREIILYALHCGGLKSISFNLHKTECINEIALLKIDGMYCYKYQVLLPTCVLCMYVYNVFRCYLYDG